MTDPVTCPISGKPMQPAFSATVLGRYPADYFYCQDSGLLKVHEPHWLDEAYQEAIADTDTGLVRRNLAHSALLEVVLSCLSLSRGRLLDLAGGHGLLTRLLRDRGFDCYSSDKYCRNLFAKTFEPEAGFRADALFAFEVLEHLEDPLAFLRDAFERYGCRTLVFSTLTFDDKVPDPGWWYYAREAGQHITFYQPRTLALLARRLGCRYEMISPELHIFTDRPVSRLRRLVMLTPWLRRVCAPLIRRRRRDLSRTWADHLEMKRRLVAANDAAALASHAKAGSSGRGGSGQ